MTEHSPHADHLCHSESENDRFDFVTYVGQHQSKRVIGSITQELSEVSGECFKKNDPKTMFCHF